MKITRRKVLSLGAGLGLLMVARRSISTMIEREGPLELIVAYKSKSTKRNLLVAHRWDEDGLLQVVKSPDFACTPHSIFECAKYVVAVPQNESDLVIFDRETLELASRIKAPEGLDFYGHGFQLKRGKSTRFIVSASHFSAGSSAEYSDGGHMLEYEISERGVPSLIQKYKTEGWVPHHFSFGPNRSEMAYTAKFAPNGRSHIVICDAANFATKRIIEIGTDQTGPVTRRLAHLLPKGDLLYYSFIEWDGTKGVGGGIGVTDWSAKAKPHWEATYTSLVGSRVVEIGPNSLDLSLFGDSPAVVLSAIGALLLLDVKTQKFSVIDVGGITGALPSGAGQTLKIASEVGIQELDLHRQLNLMSPAPGPDLSPVSHLFCSTA